MHDMCQLVDGPAQRERDRVFQEEKPRDGFPNPWADPGFQEWMWAFDAKRVAEMVWNEWSNEERIKSDEQKEREVTTTRKGGEELK